VPTPDGSVGSLARPRRIRLERHLALSVGRHATLPAAHHPPSRKTKRAVRRMRSAPPTMPALTFSASAGGMTSSGRPRNRTENHRLKSRSRRCRACGLVCCRNCAYETCAGATTDVKPALGRVQAPTWLASRRLGRRSPVRGTVALPMTRSARREPDANAAKRACPRMPLSTRTSDIEAVAEPDGPVARRLAQRRVTSQMSA